MPRRNTKSSKRFLLVLSFLCFWVLLGIHRTSSHEPVTTGIRFNKEIVRIFQDHCLACPRRRSNTAVFLHACVSARPWARAIKEEVLERRMPPQQAVKGFGRFDDDYGLTQHEVDQIVAWVDGGTPKGDDKDLPPDQVRPANREANKETDDARIKILGLRATEEVPAGAEHYRIENSFRISAPTEAIAIRPLLFPFAQSLVVTAYRPDGTTEVLAWAQDYRYDWQPTYNFKEPVRLPKGTRLRAVAYVNNGSN